VLSLCGPGHPPKWFAVWGAAVVQNCLHLFVEVIKSFLLTDSFSMMNPYMVDHIVINTMIGSDIGANGVIKVFTRKADQDSIKLKTFSVKGFERPITFNDTIASKGSTLYWNPSLSASFNQAVIIDLPPIKKEGTYRIVIEGVTNKGKTFRNETQLVKYIKN
jgi:hypothetical protein